MRKMAGYAYPMRSDWKRIAKFQSKGPIPHRVPQHEQLMETYRNQ